MKSKRRSFIDCSNLGIAVIVLGTSFAAYSRGRLETRVIPFDGRYRAS